MRFFSGNPRQLSLMLAFITASIAAFSYWIAAVFADAYWPIGFFVLFATFVLTYYISRYILSRVIYEKIKLIYKTITTTKLGKEKKSVSDYTSGDVISRVNEDVRRWSEAKNVEIRQLKTMETYRREFLGNVSHELKTPITTIQGYVLTLLDGGLEDPSINKKYLKRTAKNINRLIAIINDLEEISRLESGVVEIRFSRFDIGLLIRDVFEFMEIKAEKRNIRFKVKFEQQSQHFVSADLSKIRQVLINLIENSIKYGHENGETTASVFDMDDHYLIEITDNGVGIDQEDLPRVFERFYRTDKSRSREMGGTGLGLAIVKHIIEAHQQSVNVRSAVGIGTTFSFTLQKAENP